MHKFRRDVDHKLRVLQRHLDDLALDIGIDVVPHATWLGRTIFQRFRPALKVTVTTSDKSFDVQCPVCRVSSSPADAITRRA